MELIDFENEKFVELVKDFEFINYFMKSTYKDAMDYLDNTSITPRTITKVDKELKKITNKNELEILETIHKKYNCDYPMSIFQANKKEIIMISITEARHTIYEIEMILKEKYNIKDLSKLF